MRRPPDVDRFYTVPILDGSTKGCKDIVNISSLEINLIKLYKINIKIIFNNGNGHC